MSFLSFETLQERSRHIRAIARLRGHEGHICSLSFSPDGRWLATGSNDHTVRLWNLSTGLTVRTFQGHTQQVISVAFSPDGRWLATGSWDRTIRLWDGTGAQEQELYSFSHDEFVSNVAWSPDGRFLAAISDDGQVHFWDVISKQQIQPILFSSQHTEGVSISFSPDGRWIATGSNDKSVRLWEVATGNQIGEFRQESMHHIRTAISPDGRTLAFGSYSTESPLRLWKISTEEERQTKQLAWEVWLPGMVYALTFSPDGSILVTRGKNHAQAIQFLHVPSGRCFFSLPQSGDQEDAYWTTSALAISNDGNYLATYSEDSIKEIEIWDISSLGVGPRNHFPQQESPQEQQRSSRAVATPLRAHLGTLSLSHLAEASGLSNARPAYWLRGLASFAGNAAESGTDDGAHRKVLLPPLFLVRDLGSLLGVAPEQRRLSRPDRLPEDLDYSPYLAFLARLEQHPLLREASHWGLSDAMISAVLARLLEGVSPFLDGFSLSLRSADTATITAAPFFRYLADGLEHPEKRKEGGWTLPPLDSLLPAAARARIESNIARLSLEELRFLHRYGPRFAGTPDPRDLLDLFSLLDLPEAIRRAVGQVLRLLPRIDPRPAGKRKGEEDIQTYSMGGYGGLAHKGSLDNLLPSERAYPSLLQRHRLLNGEALYYGRESDPDDPTHRELCYILTEAGPGVRGDMDVLARALTLCLGQHLQRRGYTLLQSFLYPGSSGAVDVTTPESLLRPADVQRILYYRETPVVGNLLWQDARPALEATLTRLRAWVGAGGGERQQQRYRRVHLFWVLGWDFDADGWRENEPLYRTLRKELSSKSASSQAWFLKVGDRSSGLGNMSDRASVATTPLSGPLLGSWQTISSSLLWEPEEGAIGTRKRMSPPARMPSLTRDPLWPSLRDTIESRGFFQGIHDTGHFAQPEQQLPAWQTLAQLQEHPQQEAIDHYLRSLAPQGMVYIPAGEFLMGRDAPEASDSSKPQHVVFLPGYYLDKNPVTNQEYAQFLAAGGYNRREFWTEAGWQAKEQRGWQQPDRWGDSAYSDPLHRVVSVSWFEALAYCRWRGGRLPSAAEWEKAASWDPVEKTKRRYPSQRIYPPTPVVSPYGCSFMAREWTNTKYWYVGPYSYPYNSDDGREDTEKNDGRGGRMLRGYEYDEEMTRWGWNPEDTRADYTGIRVAAPIRCE